MWRRYVGLLGLLVLAVAGSGCGPKRVALMPPAPPPRPTFEEIVRAHPLGCIQNERIDAWERRLRHERRFRRSTEIILDRAEPYLPRLVPILRQSGVPSKLAFLPVIESAYVATARGTRDSVGLWQIQTATARRFGLVVRRGQDERLHPERATQAAARYLSWLYERYQDWPLALAAYNAGEGRVDRALRGRPDATFWDLADAGRLPSITRDYVPRFIAVVRLVHGNHPCSIEQRRPLQVASRSA
jgi:membrane-bound lytic murein transglycosylase D